MIKEKYIPLLLAHQIRGITTIGVTHKLQASEIITLKDYKYEKNDSLFDYFDNNYKFIM